MQFNVEEENLICLYHNADRRRTMAKLHAALPDMDERNGGAGPPDPCQTGHHDRRRL